MKAIRPWPLIIFALFAGVFGWIANALAVNAGYPALRFPWSALVTMGLIAAVTFGLGFAVWRSRTGKSREPIDPLLAARVLVLGQASAHAGAIIAGWHVGIIAGLGRAFAQGGSESTRGAVAALIGGLVLIAVGIIVEYFCRIPPEEGDSLDSQLPPGQPEPRQL